MKLADDKGMAISQFQGREKFLRLRLMYIHYII